MLPRRRNENQHTQNIMKFKPKTEKELAAEALIPDGVYPFDVIDAKDAVSKSSGNEMIAIKVRVYGPDGREPVINDYLLESYMRKIYNFAKVTNNLAKYYAGSLCAEDCLGKSGFVKIGTDKGKAKLDAGGRETGDFYDPKNTVKDYCMTADGKKDAGSPQPPAGAGKPQPTPEQLANLAPAGAAGGDEDVPF